MDGNELPLHAQEFRANRVESFADQAERIARKYNIDISFIPSTWACVTTLPVEMGRRVAQNMGIFEQQNAQGTKSQNFDAVSGGIIRHANRGSLPRTEIKIGTGYTPTSVRQLSFMGEFMGPEQHLNHKSAHELGHIAAFYEMIDVLDQVFPGVSLDDSLKMVEDCTKWLRQTGSEMSQLDQLRDGNGTSFYDQDELPFEDLAEAFAIRMSGIENWRRYINYMIHHSRDPQGATEVLSHLSKIIDLLYSKAIT